MAAGDREVRLLTEVSPEQFREATSALDDVVRELLPRAFPVEVTWKLVATSFIARIFELVESVTIAVESGRHADAMVTLRVLFDHAATFCWLGIDPEAHVDRWREWDDYRLLKLHNDASQFGVEVLTPDELAEIGDPPRPPNLPELAEAVDSYWPQHSEAFRAHPESGPMDILTFRGLYTAVFRKASTVVHATQHGIERQIRLTASQIVVSRSETPSTPPDVPALAIPLAAFALLVYGHHFDWPDAKHVRGITDALTYEPEG